MRRSILGLVIVLLALAQAPTFSQAGNPTLATDVTAAEIQLLKPFHGYLCVAGNDRTSITIPERHLERHHPTFIPRTRSTAAAAGSK